MNENKKIKVIVRRADIMIAASELQKDKISSEFYCFEGYPFGERQVDTYEKDIPNELRAVSGLLLTALTRLEELRK